MNSASVHSSKQTNFVFSSVKEQVKGSAQLQGASRGFAQNLQTLEVKENVVQRGNAQELYTPRHDQNIYLSSRYGRNYRA